MPELPEVQTVVTTLAPRVLRRRIDRVVHLRGDMVTAPPDFDLAKNLAGKTSEVRLCNTRCRHACDFQS
jgi:formamidopyrimidine-DNA glycosylase